MRGKLKNQKVKKLLEENGNPARVRLKLPKLVLKDEQTEADQSKSSQGNSNMIEQFRNFQNERLKFDLS